MKALPEVEAIIFRPPWYLLVFWYLCGGVMLLFGVTAVGYMLDAPSWVRWFFIVLPSLALIAGFVLSFASVSVDRTGITSRHFKR